MPESSARAAFRRRLIEAAREDPRIVGLLDYGSSSEGRLDEWSDADAAVFLRDDDFDAFMRDWRRWAAGFGDLLLAYVGYVGHPWAVYDAEPVPLRVDFDLFPESAIERLAAWPNSPSSVEAMLWYDGTAGRITEAVRRLVGKDLRPTDPAAVFERDCGDLWYFLNYCYCKLQRREQWVARQVFHLVALEALLRLLRLRVGATEHWQGSQSAFGLEAALDSAERARLDACIPGPDLASLAQALHATALLGHDTCAELAATHGWPWPHRLADLTVALLADFVEHFGMAG